MPSPVTPQRCYFIPTDAAGTGGHFQAPKTWEEIITAVRALKDAGNTCQFVTNGDTWRVLEQFQVRHAQPIATRHDRFEGLDAEDIFQTTLASEHLSLVRLAADTRAGIYKDAFNVGERAMTKQSCGSYVASIFVMKGHDEDQIAGARAFLDFLRSHEQTLFTAATRYVPVTTMALQAAKTRGDADSPQYLTASLGVDPMNRPSTPDMRGIRLGFHAPFRDVFMQEPQNARSRNQPCKPH